MQIQKYIHLLLLLSLLSFQGLAQKKYSVAEIPDPKKQGQDYFVSDPDGVLGGVDSLNRLITKLEKQTRVEIAVVVVKDFQADLDEWEFGLDLFRKWGIGKKGSNNGLLLFAAVDRRKYRFVTGYGLEGLLPDAKLKQIGDDYLVPAFKEERYADGITAALNAVAEHLTSPENDAEIKMLNANFITKNKDWLLPVLYSLVILVLFNYAFKALPRETMMMEDKKKPFVDNEYGKVVSSGCAVLGVVFIIGVISIVFFDSYKNFEVSHIPFILYIILSFILFLNYFNAVALMRKLHQDDENFFTTVKAINQRMWWWVILSPLLAPAILWNRNTRINLAKKRFLAPLDSKKRKMLRVDRDINIDGKPFLTGGQRNEEVCLAYDHDIWETADHKEHLIKTWPAEKYDDFKECPKCIFRTFSSPFVKTVTAATYTHSGSGREIRECKNCDYEEFIRDVILPMLVRQSSSSSGSSSSGSSGSSSSGSWGGGSSGGGGSGGSW